MAFSFTRLSWWLLGSKEKAPALLSNGKPSIQSHNADTSGIKETDSVKFSRSFGSNSKAKTSWNNKEERRTDKQCDDLVLIHCDGSLYFSEPDGPEWSIGWVEPHGRNFYSDDEEDDGFAVLVPCYTSGSSEHMKTSNNHLLRAIKDMPNDFSSDGLWSGLLLSRASQSLSQPK